MTDMTCCFSVAGPTSDALLGKLGAAELVGQPPCSHARFGVAGQPVVVSVGSGLSDNGYTFIAGHDVAGQVWQHLVDQVCTLASTYLNSSKRIRTLLTS